MIDILRGDSLFPCVATRIEQIQTAAGVLKPDARAATVFGGLGVVRIVAVKDKGVVLLLQSDSDGGRRIAVHTMLEGILNERDKEQWSHF